jgi:Ca2+/Na+ antiporter
MIFSFSPILFGWYDIRFENCNDINEMIHDFIMVGTLSVLVIVLITILIYVNIYIFVIREKKRKITDFVRNKSLPTAVEDLNKKLEKNLIRLGNLQIQVTFFIAFASISIPYMILLLVQIIDETHKTKKMNSNIEIAKNFCFALGQLILTIEPIMFYLSFRNIKRFF